MSFPCVASITHLPRLHSNPSHRVRHSKRSLTRLIRILHHQPNPTQDAARSTANSPPAHPPAANPPANPPTPSFRSGNHHHSSATISHPSRCTPKTTAHSSFYSPTSKPVKNISSEPLNALYTLSIATSDSSSSCMVL